MLDFMVLRKVKVLSFIKPLLPRHVGIYNLLQLKSNQNAVAVVQLA